MGKNIVQQELNDEIATRLVVAASSLAQWLSLHDTRRQSEINSALSDVLMALEHQCKLTREKLELTLKPNKQ